MIYFKISLLETRLKNTADENGKLVSLLGEVDKEKKEKDKKISQVCIL